VSRSAFSDVLQVFPFWLFDVAPIEGISIPIFNPLAGFSSVTAPGMSFEMHDITEGNWHFRRKVIKKVDVDSITATRGATFFDSDFWRWTVASVTGNPEGFQIRLPPGSLMSIGGPTPRRNLLLIQFFAHNPLSGGAGGALAAASAGLITTQLIGSGAVGATVAGTLAAGAGGIAAKVGGKPGYGPFEFTPRVPAKAWLLHDCIPVRFKTGSDFDASSGDVSIAEIEFQPEMFDEISLSA
jgi:hypothetical protein